MSWKSKTGAWKFYKDGDVKGEGTLKKGHTIRGGGTLVLGQDQDSVGGGFDADQSFQGMLSYVNMWDEVLLPKDIKEMSTSCLLDEWNEATVYKWPDFLSQGGARLVKPSPCKPLAMGR